MRIALETLVAFMLVAILAGFVIHNRVDNQRTRHLSMLQASVERMNQEVRVRGVLDAPGAGVMHPAEIDPAWFADQLPRNPLLRQDAPWLEIVGPADAKRDHPRDPVATGGRAAQFWYNPASGQVRARVPGNVPESTALEWYNFVNGTDLTALFANPIEDAL